MDRITVFYNRKKIIGKGMSSRTIERDQELPKNCFYTEQEALDSYLEKEALIAKSYEEGREEASNILDTLENDIKQVLSRHNAELYYDIHGDIQGIYDEGFKITIRLNGFEYSKSVEF